MTATAAGRSEGEGRPLDPPPAVRRPGGARSFLRWLNGVPRRGAGKLLVAGWRLRSSILAHRIRAGSVRTNGTPGGSAPAFDLRGWNPIGLRWDAGGEVAALGPPGLLPPGVEARRAIHRRNLRGLRRLHHLEDTAAFHADVVARAGELVRLAASGVVVHLADGDQRLRPLLGDDLYALMTTDARSLDADTRELLGIRMCRTALRNHSSWARARQADPRALPLVSVLLATRRPRFLPWILAAVAAQTWPRLELVLALHGEGFVEVERRAARLPHPVKVLRVPASEPLGAVLDAATEASGGTLLAKMDDDDVYGADHLWDLVLAHEYSGAQLVGKWVEFMYLHSSGRTIRRFERNGERWSTSAPAGGTLLVSRRALDLAGGWHRAPGGVDRALAEAVLRTGGRVYHAHGAGYMLIRHGCGHTWTVSDDAILAKADRIWHGWNPALADIEPPVLPHPAWTGSRSVIREPRPHSRP